MGRAGTLWACTVARRPRTATGLSVPAASIVGERLDLEPLIGSSHRREVSTVAKSSSKPSKSALSKAGKKLAGDSTSKAGKSKAGSTLGKG